MEKSLSKFLLRSLIEKMSLVNWIIAVNAVLFIVFSVMTAINPNFINYIALKPSSLLQGKVWLLLTSMFMHAGWGHLFMNMFSLLFVGNFLEKIIGRKRFLIFYLASGIIAGIIYCLLAISFGNVLPNVFGTLNTRAVGASGAIFGLLGLLAILTPKARVYLIAGPLIAIIIQSIFQSFTNSFSVILSFIVSFYFILSLIAILSFNPKLIKLALPLEMPFYLLPVIAIIPLVLISFFVSLPIGNTAHFGGLLAGLAYGWYLRVKYRKKVSLLNRMIK